VKDEANNAILPKFIKSVGDELHNGYWTPQNISEWALVQKTSTFLNIWSKQQDQERNLRRMIGIWVFVLITIQILSILVFVALDATGLLILNTGIVKLLIPSVLSEVFGMGLIVVKYLFKIDNSKPFDINKIK
jgi:hypothetical protein